MIGDLLSQAAAAETAPVTERQVFARDARGGAKRIPISVADRLVADGLADRVSAAGHVRLKPGYGIEQLETHHGASANKTTRGRQERQQHHPRCADWRRQA